jgi:hypothetical protein
MKRFILLTLFALILKTSSAQLTKGNWLVGGSGFYSFMNYNTTEGNPGQRRTLISLSPDIGYFLADKFAAGLKLRYTKERYKTLSTSANGISKYTTYSAGPFIRYYILPAEKQFNLLLAGSYQYGHERGGGGSSNVDFDLTRFQTHDFSLAACPVIYFNSSVGLEFLAEYTRFKYAKFSGLNSTFQVGFGLQVHLDRDN